MTRIREYFNKKNVTLSPRVYFIDVMGKMMLGLFATLLMSSIFGTLNDFIYGTANVYDPVKYASYTFSFARGENVYSFLAVIEYFASLAAGPAIGVAIAVALKAPPLVCFSAAGVGAMSNAYKISIFWVDIVNAETGAVTHPLVAAGPLGAFFAVLVAVEVGKLLSGTTKVDIIVTPMTTLLSGAAMTLSAGWVCSVVVYYLGRAVDISTGAYPLLMGIIIAVAVGMILTLPISSAALCAMIGISGLAGGAAVVGCCAQMVGFAVSSYRENKVGGLVAQGIGTSMLQMPNIIKRPLIWIPPTIASAVVGALATTVFKLECAGLSAGMGTCGFVGPIGIFTTMTGEGKSIAPAVAKSDPKMWLGIILLCFIIPAAVSLGFSELMRKTGAIKHGDMKLELK